MTARTVAVGLLGYGIAGKVFHAPVINAVPQLRLAAVMTSRSAEVAHDLPGVAVVATPEHIFDDAAIELVVIATPNPSHFELAQRALRAGKHVVIDKPMTTTSADADALITLADECDRLLSVYQNRRWDGDFLTVGRCVEAGVLGHIYAYEARYDRFRPAIKHGWRETPAPGSGLLFDLGAHLIDQALQLFGMPETIVADVLLQRPQAQVDDYFAITMGYRDRRAIVGASTLVAQPGPHFAIHGDGGSFVKYGMDPQEAALKAGQAVGTPGWGSDDPARYGTLTRADGSHQTLETVAGSYATYYAGMAAAIVTGEPVPVTARQGRDVIRVIELARRSALERRTVATVP